MDSLVLGLEEIARIGGTQVALAGGKAAHLAELSRIEGIRVPAGFCVTADAFRRVVAGLPVDAQLERLARVDASDGEAIRAVSADLRALIEGAAVPGDLAAAITRRLVALGEEAAYAVRSSATAEDLPTASFAGQLDTFLDVVGAAAVVAHVRRCWASLFSERAVTYRARNGFDHRKVHMAVVVQRMLSPRASGVLFTADPVTSNRKIACVEAVAGLGEALVSGRANADVYRVRGGVIVERVRRHDGETLTGDEAVRLVELGRRIEAHFGRPQDIEWCLVDDDFHFVQSRPITTLFPIPEAADGENHVYVSVGHPQMMTDAMKPLGLSVWKLTALRPMDDAGGRLFVDVTRALASPASRAATLAMFGKGDPLLRDALETLLARGDFVPLVPDAPPRAGAIPTPPASEIDASVIAALIAQNEASVDALARDIATKSGPALFDFILADLQELKRLLSDPPSPQAIMAGMEATWWLHEKIEAWLGDKNAADALTLSAPNNVTSQMGLALLDVADAIRPHPEVVAFLGRAKDDDNDGFLDELPKLAGGQVARDAIAAWLETYGARCVGEIDITRPRFSERPQALLPMVLAHVERFAPGEAARRFAEGEREAAAKEQELLERLRALPDGDAKADETRRMITRLRTCIGYREYPKFGMVRRFFVYKQALLREAARLVEAGVLRHAEDVFFLTFAELHDVARTRRVDDELLRNRKDAFRSYQALTPPRVLTSDGEVLTGAYRRDDLPPGALAGLAVSGGTVEGRARVVLDPAGARLEPGDILVTPCTDPSWTPAFLAVKGLVTEVGGLMTHGAVIAREYGLPAVVGVENATRLIRDGQRIRVHGTAGYVELLFER